LQRVNMFRDMTVFLYERINHRFLYRNAPSVYCGALYWNSPDCATSSRSLNWAKWDLDQPRPMLRRGPMYCGIHRTSWFHSKFTCSNEIRFYVTINSFRWTIS
jgi:hypothetical protein